MRSALKVRSIEELWRKLKEIKGLVRYIAGGTDFTLTLKKDFSEFVIVDISDVKELREIKVVDGFLFIGAGVKINEFATNSLVKKYAKALYRCVDYYASPSIRNMATVGGNVANASPCADGVLALCAMGAKAVLNLYGEKRIVWVEDIACDVKKTILREREIIEGFLIPLEEKKAEFFKIMPRKKFGIAKSAVCISAFEFGGFLYDVRVYCSSVGPKIIFAQKTSSYLESKKIDNNVINTAKEIIKTEIAPITDQRSTSDYRRHITSILLERAVVSLLNG